MAPIEKRFHRSMYITLGLACAGLGYAELELLPEITAFAGVVLVLFAVAYRLEGRWSMSLRAANVAGGVIGVATLYWFLHQVSLPDGLYEQLRGPQKILPFLGPLLMILVPAKLFRPKHNGDFWALQGIGLIAVALGSALTGEPIFGIILICYLFSAVWSLTLFYYFRQKDQVGGSPPPGGLRVFGRANGWAAGIAALGLVLFLVTPRIPEARWEYPGITQMQTGVDDARPVIDLNRSGTLTANRQKVFEVHAFSIDCPNPPVKLDVDPLQHWRQMTFSSYAGGKWNHHFHGSSALARFDNRRDVNDPQRSVRLANLGAGQYYFEFHLAQNGPAPRRVFGEPIAFGSYTEAQHIESPRSIGASRFPWVGPSDDPSIPPFVARIIYDQVVLPTTEPGVSPPDQIDDADAEQLRACASVPNLQNWVRALLRSFVEQGRLPSGVLGRRGSVPFIPGWVQTALIRELVNRGWPLKSLLEERVPPRYYEAVSRAFEDYLAHSGQFKYSMTLTRKDTSMDPVEDFVLNTRKGHCERFASALALMLRSVGVPTQIVLGYRGYETTGNGQYDVLQCHAHSWVEAVIYRPPTKAGESPWRWLTLDPTPSLQDAGDEEFTWRNWWQYTRQGATIFFKNFIVEYDADRQERTRTAMSQWNWWEIAQSGRRFALGPNGDNYLQASLLGLAGLALAVGLKKVVRRPARTREPASAVITPVYGRLLAILKSTLGISPRPGDTAEEFAVAAGERLRAMPSTCAFADVPAEVAAVYYRIRFGDLPLNAEDKSRLDILLNDLETALRRPTILKEGT